MFTVGNDVASGEVRHAVSVSTALCLRNGLSAQLVSSILVKEVSGTPFVL